MSIEKIDRAVVSNNVIWPVRNCALKMDLESDYPLQLLNDWFTLGSSFIEDSGLMELPVSHNAFAVDIS